MRSTDPADDVDDGRYHEAEVRYGHTSWLSHSEMKILADSGVNIKITLVNNCEDDSPLEVGGMTFTLLLVASNGKHILGCESHTLGGCVAILRAKNNEVGGSWEGILEGEILW